MLHSIQKYLKMVVVIIKHFFNLNKILFVASLILEFILIITSNSPMLPVYRWMIHIGFGPDEIKQFALNNFFAVAYFVIAITIGVLTLVFAVMLYKRIKSSRPSIYSIMMLGIFILDSGYWILTNSTTLVVFSDMYGNVLNLQAVNFTSYISFMLLPIFFIAFSGYVYPTKVLYVFKKLFLINMVIFSILAFFNLPETVYFGSLMIHHALIYIMFIIVIIRIIRKPKEKKDKFTVEFMRGLMGFMFSTIFGLVLYATNHPKLYVIACCVGFYIFIIHMMIFTAHMTLVSYEQSKKSQMYQSIAFTDAMTQLKNRYAFEREQYDKTVNELTGCILLDVNKLKYTNDTLGHAYGDKLICKCADIVFDSFSDIGECYRIGGDEFVVVCHNTDEYIVKKFIDRLHENIEKANSESEDIEVSIAYGYAFGTEETNTFTDLLHVADKYMYKDKKKKHDKRKD